MTSTSENRQKRRLKNKKTSKTRTHFEIRLASGKTDFHCMIKETLIMQELYLTLNTNLTGDRKLSLY